MDGFRRILVPTDFSVPSLRAVARAASLAREFGAKVLLLYVVEKTSLTPMSLVQQAPVTLSGEGDLLGEAVEFGEKRLKELRDSLFAGVETETRITVAANATSGILDICTSYRPDLIIVGDQGRSGAANLLMGGTAERVARHAPTTVLIVRDR